MTAPVPARCRYDRQKLTLKDIHNCQYVACMNPTAGSFTIDPRLQVSTFLPGQLQQKHRFGCEACGLTFSGALPVFGDMSGNGGSQEG